MLPQEGVHRLQQRQVSVRLLQILRSCASCNSHRCLGDGMVPCGHVEAACHTICGYNAVLEGSYRLGAQKPVCMMQPGQWCAGSTQACIMVEAAMQHNNFGRVSVAPSW